MSTSAFSTADVSALEREVEVNNETVTLNEIWNDYHQNLFMDWIKTHECKRICLQFPDNYLEHSNQIFTSMATLLSNDAKLFIMADTSYGACCVDEVAAEHVSGDGIVHFGNACRTKSSRLPVLYLFPYFDCDTDKLALTIKNSLAEKCQNQLVYIFLDVGYHHLVDEDLAVKLKPHLPCQELQVEVFPATSDKNLDTDNAICIFLGSDNNNFFQLSLNTKAALWYIYDVKSNNLSEKNPLTTNYIRRRYFYIEKCKDAAVLGLIVGTLSADGYLDMVDRLAQMAKARGVKTKIISVGRINPAKLANFLEIDCYVLIGCPFNNMYNTKDFYKPIVSVFEAEMALNPAWHAKYPDHYVSDFKQLLPSGRSFLEFKPEDLPEQDVSLISGSVRQFTAATTTTTNGMNDSAVAENQNCIVQPKMALLTSNTGLTFEDRTWRGLEQALGETEPAKLQRGLSGIPIKYTHD